MSIDFKGSHYPKDVILYAVFFYVRYFISCRDLEEIITERDVQIDHATLNRWVVKYSPYIAKTAQTRKQTTAGSWRNDETYIKVKCKWMYLYQAITNTGKPLISCFPGGEIMQLPVCFSGVRLIPMARRQEL